MLTLKLTGEVDAGQFSGAFLVALFTIADRGQSGVQVRASTALAVVALAGHQSILASNPAYLEVGHLIGFSGTWALGTTVRGLREHREDIARREQAAAASERERIARDLHDTVAHHFSVISLHAAGAQVAVEDRDAQSQAIEVIRRSAGDALGDMRALLALLRGDPSVGDDGDGAATEGLARVPGAGGSEPRRRAWRGAGGHRLGPSAAPRCRRRGVPHTPREVLTNVRRHAGPAAVRIRLTYRRDELEVAVADDGRGPHRGPGNGLRGMRERVQLLGGHLEAGPGPGGGFALSARLPLPPAP